MNKTANVKYVKGQMYINTPYDAGFVATLKSAVKARKWDAKKKEWIVDIREREAALDLLKRFYTVVEVNPPPEIPPLLKAATPNYLLRSDISPSWLSGEGLEIWTDGACHGNPGPGGYGIIFKHHGERKARSGGFKMTTNNRMEILAAIVALETLVEKTATVIYSDSQYLVKAMTQGWAMRWKAAGWKRNRKDKALNPDLWDRLMGLCEKHTVEFRWIKGHDLQVENEWCDQLAETAASQPDLPVDPGYQGEIDPSPANSVLTNPQSKLL
jgi:ribonuclease HI